MKKLINISQKWRKFTAVMLLLSFAVTPLLNAFPQETCNGVCEMSSTFHECGTEIIDVVEKDCCNMMEMNSKSISIISTKCGMEISDINCGFVINKKINSNYIIPKITNNKVELIQITTIDLQKENTSVELFELIHEFSYKNGPSIFLNISSFLI